MRVLPLLLALLLVGGCGVRPSGVIRGTPAPDVKVRGTALYLLHDGRPVLALRESRVEPSPIDALTLLAAGPTPDERSRGLTSEVPADAVPVSVAGSPDRPTITLATNVSALSILAVQQIVCTVASGRAVILAGGGERRGPMTCPQ